MKQFRYGVILADKLAFAQAVDVKALKKNGFFMEFVTESPEITVYYVVNGYLQLGLLESKVIFKEDFSCCNGHLLLRLKNSTEEDVLWSAGIYSHGSLYEVVSTLLSYKEAARSAIQAAVLFPEYQPFCRAVEMVMQKKNITPWTMEEWQYSPLIPQLSKAIT